MKFNFSKSFFQSFEKGVEQSGSEEYRNEAEELKESVGKIKTELDEKTASLENVPTCIICFEKPVSSSSTFMVTLREILPGIFFV